MKYSHKVIALVSLLAGVMVLETGAVTVTTVQELLDAAAAVGNNGVIEIASPNGQYPVKLMMTQSLAINSDGSKYSIKLRGATGNPEDVILDFSSQPLTGPGVSLRGTYHNYSYIQNLTVQGATNTTSNGSAITAGGGISTQDCTVQNCIVRDCVASHTGGTPRGGGIMYHCKVGMENCVVSNCAAISLSTNTSKNTHYAAGGGIFVRSGTVSSTLVTNCWTETNVAAQNGGGGGIGTEYNAGLSLYGVRVINCRTIQRNSTYSNYDYGGGVYCGGHVPSGVPERTFYATNCYFACNSAVNGGGVWASTGAMVKLIDCTFDRNAGTALCANNNYSGNYLRNCMFLGNTRGAQNVGGTIENCLFKENSAGQGAAYFGCAKVIRNCVFESNRATSTTTGGGGALWLGGNDPALAANRCADMVIEDCLFKSNVTATSSGNIQQGSAIGADWGNYVQTNMVIRNCYFKDNDGSGGAVAIKRLRNETFEPTFENGYGLNFVNCTFDGTVSPGKQIITSNCTGYTSGDSVFVRNCHFTGSPEYKIANDGWMSIYTEKPDHFQYCVADVGMSALTTAAACHNSFGTKIRNKGYTQPWMTGTKDMGNGTYTLRNEADYGVTISFNNRKDRVREDCVDIGCFERTALGTTILAR